MNVIKISVNDWEEGVKRLREPYRLVGPETDGEVYQFAEIDDDQLLDFNFKNTRLSAKNCIYPQSQIMFTYSLDEKVEGHHVMNRPDSALRQQLIIGIRPCDAAAFLIAQKNFDSADYRDPYWADTYDNTLLVGYACDAPDSTCFCTSVGLGPYSESGLDILLATNPEGGYVAKILTEKGESICETAGWKTKGDISFFESQKTEAEAKITARIEKDQIKKLNAKALFEAPFWDDLAFGCLNCGTCTYSCPTCWCFDIQDENAGNEGTRMRNWDSCMSPLFTLEGSGHNPRPQKHHRVRQRFMHKLKYYTDKYGEDIMCVGCGRCIKLCPVNIDIRKVSKTMNNYHPPA